jgi:hypothetical protein
MGNRYRESSMRIIELCTDMKLVFSSFKLYFTISNESPIFPQLLFLAAWSVHAVFFGFVVLL